MYIVNGYIGSLIVTQKIENGRYDLAVVNAISGNYTIETLSGRAVILGDEDPPPITCDTDEECEEHLLPMPPYEIKCVDGVCKYVQPDT